MLIIIKTSQITTNKSVVHRMMCNSNIDCKHKRDKNDEL